MTNHKEAESTIVIDGSIPSWANYFRELYQYREVGRVLVRRDLIVRFRQTFFGVAWLLFKPLMMMMVISLAFGFISRFESGSNAPYPLVVLCGVIPWYFLTNAIPDGMHSIVGHLHIIQKTYFPRIIVPLTAVAVNVIELIVAWLLFALLCIWYGFVPSWQILALPVFLALAIILALGLALWLSLLHARFRDVGNLVPFLIGITFFVSPIGYTLSAVPEAWQGLFMLNPVVGIVEGVRWSLLGGVLPLPVAAILSTAGTAALLLMSGLWYFRHNEAAIVDIA